MKIMRTILILSVLTICFLSAYAQRIEKIWSTKAGLQTPESALYNDDHEIVYVSNMGLTRDVKNGDGFISLLTSDGEIANLHWVKGLNDPKGIALWGKNIYVADINEVVIINIESGKIEKKHLIPQAKFLNDVTACKNGQIFISDMNDQQIYILDQENINSWKSDAQLENVNGLFASNGFLYAGNKSIWEIDINTGGMTEVVTNAGGVDGLVKIDNNTYLFSNWIGKIFISRNGEVIQLLDTSVSKINTADISYSPELDVLFVPTFSGNSVDAYKIILE
jgi:outer membrane protein assembly factor BamB